MGENNPGNLKPVFILFGIVLVAWVLYVERDIFIPITYAAFLSILLAPICDYLESRKVPKVVAISICLILAFTTVTLVLGFIGMQLGRFGESLPQFEKKFDEALGGVQMFLEREFDVSSQRQLRWLREWSSRWWENGALLFAGAMLTAINIAGLAMLVPIYVFLFLFYRRLIEKFLIKVLGKRNPTKVAAVLRKVRSVLNKYLVGISIETAVVAILNTLGLLALGVEYAVLFGTLAALMNLIPYIGILVASVPPALLALVTTDSFWYPLGVLGVFTAVQLIDNNILVPVIVGSKVSINGIAAIIALLLGAQLWGLSGLILALPLVAMLKVVFDSVSELEPWGMIMGDSNPKK